MKIEQCSSESLLGGPTVQLYGVNHHTARAELRDRLAITESESSGLLAIVSQSALESVVLSTCNRTEIYTLADDDSSEIMRDSLSAYTGVSTAEIEAHAYAKRAGDAVGHLIAVASGLDSMIIGEPQILGQVGRAAQLSREAGTSGPTLNTLFRYAQEAGKHVRSRTLISRGATSIAHAAVEIARQHFGKLSGRKVLVLGAGETGRVAALNLISAGVGELIIANRTPQKAQNLAARLNGRAVPLDQLPDVLAEVDMLIACSSSREPLVSLGVILNATAGRDAERRLLVMDIATPRNVVPEADDAPGVQVYDLDGVQRLCERNRHARRMAARGAEAGIADWVERFAQWQREREAVPLIRALCERADRERAADLHALLQCAPTLDDAQCRTVEAMSRTITNRMLHQQLLLVKQFNSNQLEAATASSSVTNDAFNIGRLNAHPDRRRHPPPSGSHSADAQSHQIAVFDEATHFDASHSLAARQTSTPNGLEAESDR